MAELDLPRSRRRRRDHEGNRRGARRGLKVPVVSIGPDQAEAHFGWLAHFAVLDMPSSSALTQQKLNRKPTGLGLIADPDGMDYTQS